MIQFNYELTKEGIAKTNALRNIPKATRKQLETWLADTVLAAMRSANEKKKGTGTSQTGRNIGMHVEVLGETLRGSVGTGVGKTQSVKYANWWDQGSHPRVTDRMRGWAWYMFKETNDGVYKGIALTKKARLDNPASHWFSSVIEKRSPLLDKMMEAESIFEVAMKMTRSK